MDSIRVRVINLVFIYYSIRGGVAGGARFSVVVVVVVGLEGVFLMEFLKGR